MLLHWCAQIKLCIFYCINIIDIGTYFLLNCRCVGFSHPQINHLDDFMATQFSSRVNILQKGMKVKGPFEYLKRYPSFRLASTIWYNGSPQWHSGTSKSPGITPKCLKIISPCFPANLRSSSVKSGPKKYPKVKIESRFGWSSVFKSIFTQYLPKLRRSTHTVYIRRRLWHVWRIKFK